MKRKHISVILFCLYMGAVALLCFARGEQLPQFPMNWFGIPADKIIHFLMFMPFPILSFTTFNPRENTIKGENIIILASFCTGIILSLSTELIQNTLGYRSYELADLMMDFAGIATGTAICLVRINRNRRRTE